MTAVRTWLLPLEAPPAPPESPEALMRRMGLVDPLLKALLPVVLSGTRDTTMGPEGGMWSVSTRRDAGALVVVATEVSAWAAAQEALGVAQHATQCREAREILALLPAQVRLVGPDWALDAAGPVVVRRMERAAVQAASEGRAVWSEEGWGAVPLSVDGRVFAGLLAPAEGRFGRARLEAWSHALSAPLARSLGVGTTLLEGLSHELRTPLHAILGYVGLLEEELVEHQAALFDLARIRGAAEAQLLHVEHLLARVRVDEGAEGFHPSAFTVEQLLAGVVETLRPALRARSVDLVVTPVDAELETDLQQLSAAVVALLRGRMLDAGRLVLKARLSGTDLVLETRGGHEGSRPARALAHALVVGLGGQLVEDDVSASLWIPRFGPG